MSIEKQFMSTQDDTSDEDEDAGWLSQSQLDLSSVPLEHTFDENSPANNNNMLDVSLFI
jgi:hypothetical protein